MQMTVAICTFNRADLLAYALEALVGQSVGQESFELLIVNNNSKDHTLEVANSFADQFKHFKVVTELKQGLSNARNRAYEEATTPWVLYLDDDAKAAPDLIAKTLSVMDQTDYQIFGGIFLPWYHFGRPIWYKDRYASNKMRYQKITTLGLSEYVCGGVFCVHKTLFEQYGGFDPNIGMIGNTIGFGEETEFQNVLRKNGVKIAYVPDMIIYHIVKENRLSVNSFFVTNFAGGRDKVIAKSVSTNLLWLIVIFMVAMGLTLFDATKNAFRLLFKKDYYIENWLIDSFRKTAKRLGIIYTALLEKYGHNSSES